MSKNGQKAPRLTFIQENRLVRMALLLFDRVEELEKEVARLQEDDRQTIRALGSSLDRIIADSEKVDYAYYYAGILLAWVWEKGGEDAEWIKESVGRLMKIGREDDNAASTTGRTGDMVPREYVPDVGDLSRIDQIPESDQRLPEAGGTEDVSV